MATSKKLSPKKVEKPQIEKKKVVMTSEQVKQMMIRCQEVQKENTELKKKLEVLEKTLMSAGIEVDEKFGDDGNHMVFPSVEELKSYKEVKPGMGYSEIDMTKGKVINRTSREAHAEDYEMDDFTPEDLVDMDHDED
jgi:hypothetical protein